MYDHFFEYLANRRKFKTKRMDLNEVYMPILYYVTTYCFSPGNNVPRDFHVI
jgi:hypothetical protein